MNVCILGGGGNAAEALSGHLRLLGHDVTYFRFDAPVPVPGVPRRPRRSKSRLLVAQLDNLVDDVMLVAKPVPFVTRPMLSQADCFVFGFPSYLAEHVGRTLGPYLADRPLITLSDKFLGAYSLARAATREHGAGAAAGPYIGLGGVPFMAQKPWLDSATVVYYARRRLNVSVMPLDSTGEAVSLLRELLGLPSSAFRFYPSLLHLAFENTHCIEHAVVDLDNLRRGLYDRPAPLYSRPLYTFAATREIERIVGERDAVARALLGAGPFLSLRAYDELGFGTASVGVDFGHPTYRIEHDALRNAPAPPAWSVWGYEDLGWSLVPLEACGRVLGVPTPRLSALIGSWSAWSRVDYRRTGRTLASLGVRSETREGLQALLADVAGTRRDLDIAT